MGQAAATTNNGIAAVTTVPCPVLVGATYVVAGFIFHAYLLLVLLLLLRVKKSKKKEKKIITEFRWRFWHVSKLYSIDVSCLGRDDAPAHR
jgi:hypothetical protein